MPPHFHEFLLSSESKNLVGERRELNKQSSCRERFHKIHKEPHSGLTNKGKNGVSKSRHWSSYFIFNEGEFELKLEIADFLMEFEVFSSIGPKSTK